MPNLIDILESFNRKERYFLLCEALDMPGLSLSAKFADKLEREIGIQVPESAFVAMDYHLDWLAAGLEHYEHKDSVLPNPVEELHGENVRLIEGSQEDIDLLVAFPSDGGNKYHIVMVEAKGYSSWESRQLESKAGRLERIFGPRGDKHPKVSPYFLMASKARPSRLKSLDKWPCWMRGSEGKGAPHIELPLAESRRIVERWDKHGNKANRNGSHFRVSGGS